MSSSKKDLLKNESLDRSSRAKGLRKRILELAAEYAMAAHATKRFVPGVSPIPVSGRVYGAEELRSLVSSSLDFWLTSGRFNDAFESGLKSFLGIRHVLTTNSGSSANLLAISALTSPLLGKKALRPGDEIITVASGFPTTLNPIIQNGLVPVFVDVDIPTYNVAPDLLPGAISKRTKAIFLAHTLGNPFEVDKVRKIAKKYRLFLVEDCCDALGSRYAGRKVGTFGDIATFSFYPAHHITTGEGGAVATNDPKLFRAVGSLRDWGRDCRCDTGQDNRCGKRFGWKLGDLPRGYDHKYIYSHLGYNLKMTDMQAAVGLAQLDRLPGFIKARKANFRYLRKGLSDLKGHFILPKATPRSDPSWFGFPLTLREDCPFSRVELLEHLDKHKIGTRLLFGGNLVRQPYMKGRRFRKGSELLSSDKIMNDTFWIGVFPGLSKSMLKYMIDSISNYKKFDH
jgi:CDP-6-deoxy-D-xylo-4-hexulose-3-dehydrase